LSCLLPALTLQAVMRMFSNLALALFLTIPASLAQRGNMIPSPDQIDPFTDPANDPYNPMGYIATNSLTGVATGAAPAV
jgi:hypothetical protein